MAPMRSAPPSAFLTGAPDADTAGVGAGCVPVIGDGTGANLLAAEPGAPRGVRERKATGLVSLLALALGRAPGSGACYAGAEFGRDGIADHAAVRAFGRIDSRVADGRST